MDQRHYHHHHQDHHGPQANPTTTTTGCSGDSPPLSPSFLDLSPVRRWLATSAAVNRQGARSVSSFPASGVSDLRQSWARPGVLERPLGGPSLPSLSRVVSSPSAFSALRGLRDDQSRDDGSREGSWFVVGQETAGWVSVPPAVNGPGRTRPVSEFLPGTDRVPVPSLSGREKNTRHKKQNEMEKKRAQSPQKDDRGRAGVTKSNSRGTVGGPRLGSPTKDRGYPPQTTPLRARSRSPIKAVSGPSRPGESQLVGGSRVVGASSASARKLSRSSGEIIIGLAPSSPSNEGAVGWRGGVRGGPPAPINTSLARAYGVARVAIRDGGQRPVVLHHPAEREPSPEGRAASQMATFGMVLAGEDEEDEAGEPEVADFESVYSQDYSPSAIFPIAQSLGAEPGLSASNADPSGSVLAQYPSAVSPLLVRKDAVAAPYPGHLSVLEEYERWQEQSLASQEVSDDHQHHRGEQSASSDLVEAARVPSAAKESVDSGSQGRTYSPIAGLISAELGQRVASKTLIGEHGWLEDTSKGGRARAQTTESKSRKFFGKVVQKTKDMMSVGTSGFGGSAGNTSATTQRKSDGTTAAGNRNLPISLTAREQSLLYCELDFAVSSALDMYLQSQFSRGRVNLAVLKRTAEDWARKGRPKVVGFRYDIETQVDIVKQHIDDFKFCGPAATNPAILGILDSMRMAAKVMAVRTYCYPDTVIGKWLQDTRKLFELIGMEEREVLGIVGIQAFFQACVSREQQQAAAQQQNAGVSGSGLAEVDSHSPSKEEQQEHHAYQAQQREAQTKVQEYQQHQQAQESSRSRHQQPRERAQQYQERSQQPHERPQQYQDRQRQQEHPQPQDHHIPAQQVPSSPRKQLGSQQTKYISSQQRSRSPQKQYHSLQNKYSGAQQEYDDMEDDNFDEWLEDYEEDKRGLNASQRAHAHAQQAPGSPRKKYGSLPNKYAGSHQGYGSSTQSYSSNLQGYDAVPRQAYGSSTQQAYVGSSQQGYSSSAHQGHSSGSQQACGGNSHPDAYQSSQQEYRTFEKAYKSPQKKEFTTPQSHSRQAYNSSPTKKAHATPTPREQTTTERRRELLAPIWNKYSPPKQQQQQHLTPQEEKAAAQKAYRTFQQEQQLTVQPQQSFSSPVAPSLATPSRLPISSSEKTLKSSYSVQASLNERKLARAREMTSERLRRSRSRVDEETEASTDRDKARRQQAQANWNKNFPPPGFKRIEGDESDFF